MDDRPRLPPLSSLRPFEATVRRESVTLAAAELGLTQTAVSKRIRALEADLGRPLFERRNRAVIPTDEARRLARAIAEALDGIGAEAARIRGADASDAVVLHCQLCEAFYWLMPRLSRFHEAHPGIELRVLSSMRPLTEAGERFDMAIQTAGRPSGAARLAFAADEEVFPVCAPGLLAGRPLPLPLAALSALPLLAHEAHPQDWMDWDDWFAAVGAPAPRARRIGYDSFPLVLQAAVAGQGVALGWRRTVQDLLDDGRLVAPCAERAPRPGELAVYRAPGARRRARIDALEGWLRAELA